MDIGSAKSSDTSIRIDPADRQGLLPANASDLERLSASTGLDFLQIFVDLLQEVIQADFIAISELRVTDREQIQVKTGWLDGEPLANFEYDACYTPCLEAIKSAQIVIAYDGVQSSFPQDELLQHKGLESFLGYPVVNANDEVIGLVQLAWRRQTDAEECDQILDTIQDFSPRIATELDNLRTMRILHALARGPDPSSSASVFHLIAQQIQTLLGARAVFVAECCLDDKEKFEILAYLERGEWLSSMEGQRLTFEGRPCKELKTREQLLIKTGLAAAYPDQERYRTAPFDSYLGVRVGDRAGHTIGHFVVFHDAQITVHKLESDLLTVFRDRLGFEILRKQADQRPAAT